MIYHYFCPYVHPLGLGRVEYTTNRPVTTMEQIERIETMIEITHDRPRGTVTLTHLPEILRVVREEDEADGAPFDDE